MTLNGNRLLSMRFHRLNPLDDRTIDGIILTISIFEKLTKILMNCFYEVNCCLKNPYVVTFMSSCCHILLINFKIFFSKFHQSRWGLISKNLSLIRKFFALPLWSLSIATLLLNWCFAFKKLKPCKNLCFLVLYWKW